MAIKHLMTFPDRIAAIQAEAVGADLTQWEKDRLNEWKALNCGSPKQNTIVDKIGERLFGVAEWDDLVTIAEFD